MSALTSIEPERFRSERALTALFAVDTMAGAALTTEAICPRVFELADTLAVPEAD
jgi:hypothetical protein